MSNYQTYKHNSENQNNDFNVIFTANTKFVLLQIRQQDFCSIHVQNLQ